MPAIVDIINPVLGDFVVSDSFGVVEALPLTVDLAIGLLLGGLGQAMC
jgi:hypothetical protein